MRWSAAARVREPGAAAAVAPPEAPRPAPGGSDGGGPDGGRGKLPGVLRVLLALRRPRARLTGLGTGALTTVVTVLAGLLDSALFDGPGTFFGVAFIAVCVAAAFYVRPYDLVAAPVAAPIAFALAITLTAGGGGGGLAGRLMGVFTGLALMTGWLYTGTVLAAVIVVVRALRLPSPRPRSPRCSAAPRGRSAR
ncbi:DUF6542 domain-containing protein [Actinacidiphila yeochonensis]|uniref:DUF6542 domain-containing protein n=1 Tax=Actinacidiphila yeochonensis TaxID=89050 RepID=UPI0012FEA9E6|nr:DUF6542 domain-containing protein [Actinacidiphila yeochonensis]